jgi:hypothetical protein
MIFQNKPKQVWRENRCCVCGSENKLTLHHIVPKCYIGKIYKLHPEIKNQILYEFDFCCLCKICHSKFNKNFQTPIHELLWEKYSVDVTKTSWHKPAAKQRVGLPTPSDAVAVQIITAEDYIKLRQFCIVFFTKTMQPKFPLLNWETDTQGLQDTVFSS